MQPLYGNGNSGNPQRTISLFCKTTFKQTVAKQNFRCLQCLRSKIQWSTHLMLFFNPLMLVLCWQNDIHTWTNLEVLIEGLPKYLWPLLPPGVTELKDVLEVFKEYIIRQNQKRPTSCEKALWKSSSETFWKNHLRQSTYWKLITMLNMSSVTDVFLAISRKYLEHLFQKRIFRWMFHIWLKNTSGWVPVLWQHSKIFWSK